MRPIRLAFLLASCWALAAPAAAQLRAHRLDNGTVTVLASEVAGGRLLSFALAGQPNFLLVDERAGNPDAAGISAYGKHVPYLGHEVWVGPQKQWWTEQALNPERARARAQWPPDPYLSLAPYALVQRTPAELVVDSPPSLVSGIQLRKRYALLKDRPNSLQLDVRATNRRNRPVVRDLWFNTRVRPDTRIYVPVASPDDVRGAAEQDGAAPAFTLAEGVLALEPPDGAADRHAAGGKLAIQPAGGWMAGFHGGQALVIQFRLQPRAAIHPDHGQVELHRESEAGGVLVMALHAPASTLAPGKAMRAAQRWTLLPYEGPATREAHLAFLRRHAQALGLAGW